MKKNDEKEQEQIETKTSLIWRLAQKLTVDDIEKMIKLHIIEPKEAKELLFRLEQEQVTDPTNLVELKKEVEFLRGLILQLMQQDTTPVTIIRYIQSPQWTEYRPTWDYWTRPFITYCSSLPQNASFSLTSGGNIMANGTGTAQSKHYM